MNDTQEYLVIGRVNALTRNGNPYATLKVAGADDERFNIMVWDLAPSDAPEVGQLVRFRNIRDNTGKKSCALQDMETGIMPDASHPLYGLMPHPVSAEEWKVCIRNLVGFCTDENLIPIINDFAEKLYKPYSQYPAATSVHHAYPGGLLNHTYQMLHMLEGLYPCLPYNIKVERCVLAILFHDYGKVYEYNRQGETLPDMYLLGHIYLSAHKLNNVLDAQHIDSEETKRIVHCILAHHGQREYGSPVLPCTQEASIVTYLDNISAKVDGIEGTGDMEYCSALGTHVIK